MLNQMGLNCLLYQDLGRIQGSRVYLMLKKKIKVKKRRCRLWLYQGKSEHQTGLAMDETSRSVNLEITEEFGETKEGKWVKENAHRACFIIRYPIGKESITGYQYEPWHLRYVGKEKVSAIYENELTLEEYFQKVKKI